MKNNNEEVKDRYGNPIKAGDYIWHINAKEKMEVVKIKAHTYSNPVVYGMSKSISTKPFPYIADNTVLISGYYADVHKEYPELLI